MGKATSWSGLRVAIVHDWLQSLYGGETLVDVLVRDVFGDADQVDVFTFVAVRELLPERLTRSIVRESWAGRLPGIRQVGHDPGRWRYLLPYMPYFFRGLALDGYDIVIASSHSCAIQARPPAGITHVCYCHTPMRYLWLPEVDGERARPEARWLLARLRNHFQMLDAAAAQRPMAYIANSTAVRDRIQRFYRRQARVIHPPVEVDELAPGTKDRDHFLWVNRLVPYKRPELVVEAFRELPQRLTMVGVGPLEPRLRVRLPDNVTIHGWLDRDELLSLYASAGGFIHVGEEDFGVTMVEALAAGTPVIALNRGGATDIVDHGRHGLLLDDPSVSSVRSAIAEIRKRSWDATSLRLHGQRFSRQRFVAEFSSYLADVHSASAR